MELIINKIRQPNLRVIPNISYKQDPSGALSMIPPRVLMIQDVRCCYICIMGSIGDIKNRKPMGNYVKMECWKMNSKL